MQILNAKKNIIVIISAPSGSGKTTLCNELAKRLPNLVHSVSYTTRARRTGERNGRDYCFSTKTEFFRKAKLGFFAEWAEYFGNLYGTPKAPVLNAIKKGKDILLSIDVQGQAKLKRIFPDSISVFVLPPSFSELKKRLRKRKTERSSDINKRLKIAKKELSFINRYDYAVINDDLKKAAARVGAIILAEKCKIKK